MRVAQSQVGEQIRLTTKPSKAVQTVCPRSSRSVHPTRLGSHNKRRSCALPLLTETQVRARANRVVISRQVTAKAILTEEKGLDATFDVFLSHSTNEPEHILLGVKMFLEDEGLSVYVDKYTDPQLSTKNVDVETAKLLRLRLSASKSLLYIYSEHSRLSRWMPWELGFMDGIKRKIGITPVAAETQEEFKGEQFLGLYPYVDHERIENSNKWTLWIQRSTSVYAELAPWIKGNEKIAPHT